MHVTKFTAENFKRLRAVAIEVDADGGVIEIRGRNAQGKTSVLDGIASALGGKKLCPDEPIRHGEDHASVEVTISPGIRVCRRWSVAKSGRVNSTLTVTSDGETVGRPQDWLDSLFGSMAFDPMAFCRMKPRDQWRQLVSVAGIEDECDSLDDEHQKAYDLRRDLKRDRDATAKAIDGMAFYDDVPDDIPSVADIESERTALVKLRDSVGTVTNVCNDLSQQINETRELLQHLEKEHAQATEAMQTCQVNYDHAGGDEMLESLDEKRGKVEVWHMQAQANQSRAAQDVLLSNLDQQVADAQTTIEDNRRRFAELIQRSTFAVDGLSVTNEAVTLKGVPFEQASAAEQTRAAVAIGLAHGPDLRVMLVRDGSLLDDESLAMLAQIAEEHDAQVFVEIVDSTGERGVVIEDGGVAGD